MNTHPVAIMLLTCWIVILLSGLYAAIFIDVAIGFGISMVAGLLSFVVATAVFPAPTSIYGR